MPVNDPVCASVRALIEPYADGELPEVLAACVQGHLAECANCARAVADIIAVDHALNRWPVLTEDDDLVAAESQEALAVSFVAMYPPAPEAAPPAIRRRRRPVTVALWGGARATGKIAAGALVSGARITWHAGALGYRLARGRAARREQMSATSRRPGSRGRSHQLKALASLTSALLRAAGNANRSVLAMG
jgi:anti-sigma factor RsiW